MKPAYKRVNGKLRRLYKRVGGKLRAMYGCCCGVNGYFSAFACPTGRVPRPDDLPDQIWIPSTFKCADNCPPTGNQVVMHRGWCYTIVPDWLETDSCGNGTQTNGIPSAGVFELPPPSEDPYVTSDVACMPRTVDCSSSPCYEGPPGDECCARGPSLDDCGQPDPPGNLNCNCGGKYWIGHAYDFRIKAWGLRYVPGNPVPQPFLALTESGNGTARAEFDCYGARIRMLYSRAAASHWNSPGDYCVAGYTPPGFNTSGSYQIGSEGCGDRPIPSQDESGVAIGVSNECIPPICLNNPACYVVCTGGDDGCVSQPCTVSRRSCSGGLVTKKYDVYFLQGDPPVAVKVQEYYRTDSWWFTRAAPCIPISPLTEYVPPPPATMPGLLDLNL